MKKGILLIFSLCALSVNAQNYLINFAGTGATTTVNTVKVDNITAGSSAILNGTDILRLNVVTGINAIDNFQSSGMKIYPNPMTASSVLKIHPCSEGKAIISVLDMTGKLVYKAPVYLDYSTQEFRLSGLKSGLYLVNIKGDSFHYSGRLLCNSNDRGTIGIEKIINEREVNRKILKSGTPSDLGIVDMDYKTGDRIKFTGISGIYSTIVMDVPSSGKTITFNFIACTDGDANNYTIVQIGTQTWMAENLRTTKFNDLSIIPNVMDNILWAGLTSPAYCWYNNDEVTNKPLYGGLYNWYAISTGKLCPADWHVPSDEEWTTLVTFLGGESVAGGKLKETGATHWFSQSIGTTNESGFTALPGGTRYVGVGEFSSIVQRAAWWSATLPYVYAIWYNEDSIYRGSFANAFNGFSIRCVKAE
jgi:uncharacterized protein (TIGR02145 family)